MRREQANFQGVGMCGHRRLPSSYYMLQIQTSHDGIIYWFQIRNNIHGVVCAVPSGFFSCVGNQHPTSS